MNPRPEPSIRGADFHRSHSLKNQRFSIAYIPCGDRQFSTMALTQVSSYSSPG